MDSERKDPVQYIPVAKLCEEDQAVLARLEKKLDRIQATLLGGNEGTPAVGSALVTLAASQQVILAKLDALLALKARAKE